MAVQRDLLRVDLLSDLRTKPVNSGSIVFLVGKNSIGDGMGGFYRWDAESLLDDEAVYLNVIKPTSISSQAPGRWIRIFQRVRVLPHGILVSNGGIKTFYASAVTNSSGEILLNLTLDNTANGEPIFSEIWFNDSKSTLAATSSANAVNSYVKNLSGNLKQTTHSYYKLNILNITLGLLYSPFTSAGGGVPIQFKIEGV